MKMIWMTVFSFCSLSATQLAYSSDIELEKVSKRVDVLEQGAGDVKTKLEVLTLKSDAMSGHLHGIYKDLAEVKKEGVTLKGDLGKTQDQVKATSDRLNGTQDQVRATGERLQMTNDALANTNAQLNVTAKKIDAMDSRLQKMEAILARAIGWDCVATCQLYGYFNGSHELRKVLTVSGHGVNASEAMTLLATACLKAQEATPHIVANQLVDTHGEMASIRNTCAYSVAPKP